jgi:hypothetical protein
MFNKHAFKVFTLAIIHVDFMGFPFKIPSVIHHNKTLITFDIGFDLDLEGSISG